MQPSTQPPYPTSPMAPAAAPGALPAPRVLDGLRALLWGFGFIVRTPAVWPLALVPTLIGLALSSAFGVLSYRVIPDLVLGRASPTSTGGQVALGVAAAVATLLAVLVGVVLGFALAQPLSGPALERIVRRAEQDLGGPKWPDTGFVQDILRSLQSVLVPLAFGLPILAALVVVNILVPFAAVVTVPLKALVAAIILAWDLCDYPLSIRGVAIQARVSFIRRNLRVVLGFSLGVAGISLLLPCTILFVLPAGVAGAARLVLELERYEASRGMAPLPSGI